MPVRISRGATSSPRCSPCGEGAGYAGGIVPAALDGQRTATALADAGGRFPMTGRNHPGCAPLCS